MVTSYLGAGGSTVLTTPVLMTGITSAGPYTISAFAQIVRRLRDPRTGHTARLLPDLTVAVPAGLPSMGFVLYSRNSGDDPFVVWGPFLTAGAAARGVETLASALFRRGEVHRVNAVGLPRNRAFTHLDTATTMVDRDAFPVHPSPTGTLRSFTLTPVGAYGDPEIEENRDRCAVVADALDLDAGRVRRVPVDHRGGSATGITHR